MSRMSPTPGAELQGALDAHAEGEAGELLGSMPQAMSTRGLTMPQPPHSTQRGPSRCSGNQTSNSADGSVNGK
jgi:hypothetical protein